MPYPKCKEFCASTGVRHEEAKLKGQGSGLLEFKGQGPEMVNVEELCWCVRPYPKNVHQWHRRLAAAPADAVPLAVVGSRARRCLVACAACLGMWRRGRGVSRTLARVI